MPVTLRDIAKACAVDVSTASRALRGDMRVKPATRERVQATAEELGYKPNLAARNLVTGKTQTIWLVLGQITSAQDHLPSQAASLYCQQHGYDLHLVMHHHDAQASRRLFERLQQNTADGAIFIADGALDHDDMLGELIAENFPLVFLDRYKPDLPALAFSSNNTEASAELVKRCQHHGATHIINGFHQGNIVEHKRSTGCQQVSKELGLPIIDTANPQAVLSSECVLAIIGSNHHHVQQQLAAISKHFPESTPRLLFACFDFWPGEPYPAERVIIAKQDFTTMAQSASQAVIDLIANKQTNQPVVHTTACSFEEINRQF